MKEFQALGLDISIINDEGETLQLKEIEDAEDREDLNLSIDELEKSPTRELTKDLNVVTADEDELVDGDLDEDEDEDMDDLDEEFMDDMEEIEDSFEEGADI